MNLSQSPTRIEKESYYLGMSLVVIGLLAFITNYPPAYNWVNGLNPIFQFLVLNIGLYSVMLSIYKFAIARGRDHIWQGSLGTYLSFMSIDLIFPEFHVSSAGLVEGGILGKSATDYFFGYIYTNLFHITGMWLWVMTYIFTFIILFVIGALIFKNWLQYYGAGGD